MTEFNYDMINWSNLLQEQTGNGMFFRGVEMQRGRGFGAIVSMLPRLIPAFLNSPVGKELISAGSNIISDVKTGSDVKTALKKRGRQSIRNLTGLGKKKKTEKPNKRRFFIPV